MKKYIGDSVYAEITVDGIELRTNNGIEDTNRIVLEPDVWGNLVKFVATARASETGSVDK